MNVKELRERPQSVSVEWESGKVGAVYNAHAITPRFQREIRQRDGEGDLEQTVRILAALLVSWDLLDEDGKTPLPLSVETLESLPGEFLGKLMVAIWEDYSPPREPEKNSGSF